jgi:alpha-methylacyl-CoA racemase
MLLALGVVAALLHVQRGGAGQVVDAAMIEGAAQLGTTMWGLIASGNWREARESNLLDGGTPWYDSYRTRDGQFMAVGAVEARFYAELLEKLGLSDAGLPAQHDREGWPVLRERFAAVFAERTRDEWCRVFEGSDACVAPVLGFSEAPGHPQHRARESFVEFDGVVQPAPAPRFSGTPSRISRAAPRRGEGGAEALREWEIDEARFAGLQAGKVAVR